MNSPPPIASFTPSALTLLKRQGWGMVNDRVGRTDSSYSVRPEKPSDTATTAKDAVVEHHPKPAENSQILAHLRGLVSTSAPPPSAGNTLSKIKYIVGREG